MKHKCNLKKLLNVNYLNITNKTICSGIYDLPSLYCKANEIPDYIALYSQPCDYHSTENTAVSFYDYDIRFDGKKGLYNAIYYKDEHLLEEYKARFKGVKFFIGPDYSICGDFPMYHNIYQYGKSREVSLWLTLELGAQVIPNIPCSSDDDLDFIYDGLENVEMIAFSTKARKNQLDKELIKKSVKHAIDKLPNLKVIIVYDVSSNNDSLSLFSEAIEAGIDVRIVDNLLRERNIILGGKNV